MFDNLISFLGKRRNQPAIFGSSWQIPMFLDMVEGVLKIHGSEIKRLGAYDVDVCKNCQSLYPCVTVQGIVQDFKEWTEYAE